MAYAAPIELRVNGMAVTSVGLRRKPSGSGVEVVVADKLVGEFALTDEFDLEVCTPKAPGLWERVDCARLLALLNEYEIEVRAGADKGADAAEARPLTAAAANSGAETKAQIRLAVWDAALRKAQRALFAAGVPCLLRVEFPTFRDIARNTDLCVFDLLVTDAPTAHRTLCENGFRAHPRRPLAVVESSARLVICLRQDCAFP
jgi:hypothetical protein